MKNESTIIIIKPDALGDFVLATPAIKLLRFNRPNARIICLVSPTVYQLAKWNTDLDIVLPVRLFKMPRPTVDQIKENSEAIKLILGDFPRDKGSAILLRWDADHYSASLFTSFLGLDYSLTYSELVTKDKAIANRNYDNNFTEVLLDKSVEHEVIKNIKLAAKFLNLSNAKVSGNLTLLQWESTFHRSRVDRLLSPLDSRKPLVMLGIGASLPHKRLDANYWVSLIRLIQQLDLQVVLVGDQNDKIIAEQICNGCEIGLNLVGQISPIEVTVVAKRCVVCIATDSFVKHAAAAALTPTIEVSAHTRSGSMFSEYGGIRFGAWGNNSRIVKPEKPRLGCTPDRCLASEPHCILDVPVSDIIDSLTALLGS